MKKEKKEVAKKEPKKLTPKMKADLEKKAQIKDVANKVKVAEEKEAVKPKAAKKVAVILDPKVKGKDLKKKKEKKEAVKPAKKEKAVKKETAKKTPKGPSNIAIAEQLLADGSKEKKIISTFTKIYEAKGVVDAEFIAKRAKIYMEIAKKNAKKS